MGKLFDSSPEDYINTIRLIHSFLLKRLRPQTTAQENILLTVASNMGEVLTDIAALSGNRDFLKNLDDGQFLELANTMLFRWPFHLEEQKRSLSEIIELLEKNRTDAHSRRQ